MHGVTQETGGGVYRNVLTDSSCQKKIYNLYRLFYGETSTKKLKNNTKVNILIFSDNASKAA